ncbi:epiphycan [Boleophthalmus pectinirostris]|uniref:epiphycan n=1 Tax=Boleophthalmus pectinirostris TaxID=150288 RepID=UPI000A1C55E0|nr:epiphycan [Boleophthalmus pectinirostris]
MRMLARLLLGLLVLKAAVASPRFSRQTDLDYDTENGEYDYELTTNLPIEVETLSTELEAEEEEEEEVPLKPQLIPQGSGGSGVLMGPDTQKEVELRLAPSDILHVSGDARGSAGSGASGESGSSPSGGSGGSGGSGDIVFISGASQELLGSGSGSGGSGEFLLSGDVLFSGDVSGSGEPSESGDLSGVSGDVSGGSGIAVELGSGFGESGDLSGSGLSGASGISGASGESGESGFSGITFIEGEGVPFISGTGPSEASGTSGEISGVSGVSGEASGDVDISGASGTSGVSASGEPEFPGVTLMPTEEGLLPTTTQSPEEGKGGVEGPESSGEPDETEEPDSQGMPTCLLCTCLGGSVYCDDLRLDSIPPLPKDTTHFYARYNRITKIHKSDFANMGKLKRIDLTANEITSCDEKAFIGLPELEELVIRENHISQLPALPETMTLIDASHNNIGSKGIHREAFKDMTALQFLYMTDNNIDYIPVPLPDSLRSLHLQRNNIQTMLEDTFCNLKDFNYIRNALEDIRLDGNPINLSRTPQAYVCLPRIPIGTLV